MTGAIYFPQPIDTDDQSAFDPPETKGTTSFGKRSAQIVGLILAIGLAGVIGSDRLPQTDIGVPVSASGDAEVATRQHITASGDRFVGGTSVVEANQVAANWRIVVAAEQFALTPEGYIRDGWHYYEWELTPFDTRWRISGGPAEIAGPPGARNEPTKLPPPTTAPTTVAIHAYLAWLLTGADGTHSGVRPTPPPYVSVAITGLLLKSPSTDIVRANVAVLAVDRFGHGVDLAYQLTLEQHRDSWIVATDDLTR